MGKRIERLKADFVRKAPVGMHCDGHGLYLKVSEGADGVLNRSWVFRYAAIESEGERRERKERGERQKERQMGLGPLERVSLADARKLAREKAAIRAAGDDPLDAIDRKRDARRVERAAAEATKAVGANQPVAPIFDHAMDAFYDANRPTWRSQTHADEWKDSLRRHVCPQIGGKRIDEIGVADILATLRPIWKSRAVTAQRVRARIERILDHGFVNAYPDDMDTASRLVAANPARLNAHLKHLLGPGSHAKTNFAALSYKEVGAFMVKLRAEGSVAARALEFTILTASRAGMVVHATWREIDTAARMWTVPAPRMKVVANGDHQCPLSTRCLEIIEEMRPLRSADDRVFPTINRTAMWFLLQTLRSGVTVHGFRSCFRDWGGDLTEYHDELLELQLAHSVGDATRRAYRRASAIIKRHALMGDWSAFCASEYTENVIAITTTKVA
jgi:integrase